MTYADNEEGRERMYLRQLNDYQDWIGQNLRLRSKKGTVADVKVKEQLFDDTRIWLMSVREIVGFTRFKHTPGGPLYFGYGHYLYVDVGVGVGIFKDFARRVISGEFVLKFGEPFDSVLENWIRGVEASGSGSGSPSVLPPPPASDPSVSVVLPPPTVSVPVVPPPPASDPSGSAPADRSGGNDSGGVADTPPPLPPPASDPSVSVVLPPPTVSVPVVPPPPASDPSVSAPADRSGGNDSGGVADTPPPLPPPASDPSVSAPADRSGGNDSGGVADTPPPLPPPASDPSVSAPAGGSGASSGGRNSSTGPPNQARTPINDTPWGLISVCVSGVVLGLGAWYWVYIARVESGY
jgi:hypothetical protein